MIRALKTLLGLVQREDATVGELVPSLPAAEAELAAGREAQTSAEAKYKAGLLTADEPGLRQLDSARRDAGMRVDRAEALVEALTERLAEAREREAEAERVAAYEAARAQADEARKALSEWYANLAADLVKLIEVVARAEVEVEAVNTALPRGAEPLASVEHATRDIPAEPDELISEIRVERWVAVGSTKPGTFDQGNIYVTGPGRGVLKVLGRPLNDCRQVELRRFTERHVRRGAGRVPAYRLAERIALPGFRPGDIDFWRPMSSGTRASEVVRQVEALKFFSPPPTSPSLGRVEVELIPEAGAVPVRELTAQS